ncbi:hypothetical protein K0M31_010203 [Melipona bicolor]|uniref:Uncharacterized protein n=1 Tax=Melipona bicolor TaxID=60889 RepID=A0AA40KI91_9HYME|nr:hypothetical protein K0M31_010203 [Melipona bicolor]
MGCRSSSVSKPGNWVRVAAKLRNGSRYFGACRAAGGRNGKFKREITFREHIVGHRYYKQNSLSRTFGKTKAAISKMLDSPSGLEAVIKWNFLGRKFRRELDREQTSLAVNCTVKFSRNTLLIAVFRVDGSLEADDDHRNFVPASIGGRWSTIFRKEGRREAGEFYQASDVNIDKSSIDRWKGIFSGVKSFCREEKRDEVERERGEVAEPNCLIDRNVVRTWTEENFSSILQCRRQRRVNSTPLRGPAMTTMLVFFPSSIDLSALKRRALLASASLLPRLPATERKDHRQSPVTDAALDVLNEKIQGEDSTFPVLNPETYSGAGDINGTGKLVLQTRDVGSLRSSKTLIYPKGVARLESRTSTVH